MWRWRGRAIVERIGRLIESCSAINRVVIQWLGDIAQHTVDGKGAGKIGRKRIAEQILERISGDGETVLSLRQRFLVEVEVEG